MESRPVLLLPEETTTKHDLRRAAAHLIARSFRGKPAPTSHCTTSAPVYTEKTLKSMQRWVDLVVSPTPPSQNSSNGNRKTQGGSRCAWFHASVPKPMVHFSSVSRFVCESLESASPILNNLREECGNARSRRQVIRFFAASPRTIWRATGGARTWGDRVGCEVGALSLIYSLIVQLIDLLPEDTLDDDFSLVRQNSIAIDGTFDTADMALQILLTLIQRTKPGLVIVMDRLDRLLECPTSLGPDSRNTFSQSNGRAKRILEGIEAAIRRSRADIRVWTTSQLESWVQGWWKPSYLDVEVYSEGEEAEERGWVTAAREKSKFYLVDKGKWTSRRQINELDFGNGPVADNKGDYFSPQILGEDHIAAREQHQQAKYPLASASKPPTLQSEPNNSHDFSQLFPLSSQRPHTAASSRSSSSSGHYLLSNSAPSTEQLSPVSLFSPLTPLSAEPGKDSDPSHDRSHDQPSIFGIPRKRSQS